MIGICPGDITNFISFQPNFSICKKLLSFKIFLAHILKNCIDEFKNFDPEEIADKYIEGEPKISEITVHQDEEIKGINTKRKIPNQ